MTLVISSPGRCATTYLASLQFDDLTIIQEREWSKYIFILSRFAPRFLLIIRQWFFSKQLSISNETRYIYLDPLLIYIDVCSLKCDSSFKPDAFLFRNPIEWTQSMESKINSLKLGFFIKLFPLFHISPSNNSEIFQRYIDELIKRGASKLSAELFTGYLEICILFDQKKIHSIKYEDVVLGQINICKNNYICDKSIDRLLCALFSGKKERLNTSIMSSNFDRMTDYVKFLWNNHFNPSSPYFLHI